MKIDSQAQIARMMLDQKRAPNVNSKTELSKKEKAAADFENMFMNLVMKSMKKTTFQNQSNALGIYRDMLFDKYSGEASQSGQLGIKEMVLEWLNEVDNSK